MPERLVDVMNGVGNVLHTFPVVVESSAASDEDYIALALKLADHALFPPDGEVTSLTARMHVSRGGPLAPYGDDRPILSGTLQGLEEAVRERAYFIWQENGHPHGRAVEHWLRALDQHLRERAYFLWLQECCPEGRADQHWRESREFENYPV